MLRSRTGTNARVVTGIVAIALAIAGFAAAPVSAEIPAAPVSAELSEPPSRAEYVERLEEMCKPGAEATRRAMEGVRQDVRKPKRLRIAARKFDRAAKIFGGTVKRIGGVPKPSADQVKLEDWFDYLGEQEAYLKRIAAQLHKERRIKAQRLTAHFIHTGNLSNNVVLAFGFDYCSFKFSRYG